MYTKEFKDKVLNEYEIDKIPSIELSKKHNINKTSYNIEYSKRI